MGSRMWIGAALAACALSAHAEVTAKDFWVRGTVPVQKTTGAFGVLTSTTDAKLVGVKSPAAKIVELHEMSMKGGIMHMQAIDSLALPAGKPVRLGPGGYHVMLIDLAKPLHPGETVPLEFVVEDAKGKRSSVDVQAVVKPLTQ